MVFGEAMLVREAPGAARRRTLLRAAAFALVPLAVLGAAVAFLLSGQAGEAQVSAMARLLDGYERQAADAGLDPVTDGDLRPLAALLDRAASMAGTVPTASAGLGLGQRAKLEAGAQAVYRDGLSFGLLPRLVWRLESQMRGDLDRAAVLYEETRLYLMLGGEGPLDPGQVRDWLGRDWEAAYPGPADEPLRASLRRHLDALLQEPLPAIALDGALVERARAGIRRVPLATRVYATIAPAAAALALPPWRPIDVLHPAGASLFARASGRPMTEGIPGLYTPAGFRSVLLPSVAAGVKAVAAEGWVLGRTSEPAPDELRDLDAAVTSLYLDEYARQWDALLADLQIAPMDTLPQAAQGLYILASPETPIRTLLSGLATQLVLAPPAAGGRIDARYQPLIALAADPAPIDRALRVMADLQQQLAKLAALPVGTPVPPGGEDIGAPLLAMAARQPQPFARWLGAVATSAQALRTGNARRQAASAFNAPGGPAAQCADAVAHYPFAATGTPLPLDAFARVFAPGGVLDGFFNTQLRAYVDTAVRPWKPRADGAATIPAADAAQFGRAAAIRDAFFPGARATPSVQFGIEPAGREAATLDLSGIVVGGGAGQTPGQTPGQNPGQAAGQTTTVTWPPEDGALPARLAFAGAPADAALVETGPWAMFRLFSRGRPAAGNRNGSTTLGFASGGRTASFTLRTTATASPFVPGLLADFRCPTLQ